MNNLLSILLLLLIISINSCEKSEPIIPHPENYWGSASAKLNEEKWIPVIRASVNQNYPIGHFDIVMDIYNTKGYHRQQIYIAHIETKVCIQHLQKGISGIKDTLVGAYFFTSIEDGDVGGDEYELIDTMHSNYFELTHYDSITNEVRGKFELTYLNLDNQNDILIFEDGVFYTKILY